MASNSSAKASESIWDIAISQQQNKVKNGEKSRTGSERNLLIVGSESVGKTTLIHRFVERTEAPKPTLALEYTFGRKNNQHLSRVNCYTVGSYGVNLGIQLSFLIRLTHWAYFYSGVSVINIFYGLFSS